MKSLRNLSTAGFLLLAILGASFSTAMASSKPSKAQSANWNNLRSLMPGEEIRVLMNNGNSYQGNFESLSDAGISLRQAGGEQMLDRRDILRVSGKTGQNHRVRNVLIGTAVGAVAGLVIGLTPYLVRRNCTEGPDFHCGSPPNPHLAEALTPAGGLAGAAIGSLVHKGGWHDVYRSR